MAIGIIGVDIYRPGGSLSSLNMTAAGVIKAAPGVLYRIVVVAGGSTSGSFVFNDCTTTGAAAASNQVLIIPEGTAVGTAYWIEWPCQNGIVLSAVPTAGSPIVAVAYL